MIDPSMKQVPPKAKKKSKARKAAIIRSLRGKYKRLDLMTALMILEYKIDNAIGRPVESIKAN